MNRREKSTGPRHGGGFLAFNLDPALDQNAESKSKTKSKSKSKSRITGPDRLKAELRTESTPKAGSWAQCAALLRPWRLPMNHPFVLVLDAAGRP
jgi:hypothetical protein